MNKSIKVNSGNAILKIKRQINEDVYTDELAKDPVISETKYLSAGEKYTFSVLPTEVVTVNIISLDNKDLEISVLGYGKEKKYTLKGTNRSGIFLAFQNKISDS